MKTVIALTILALIFVSVATQDVNSFVQFQNYVQEHGRNYDSLDDLVTGFQNFQTNQETAQNLNQTTSDLPAEDAATFGTTKFADMSPEQFSAAYLNLDIDAIKNSTQAIELRYTLDNQIADLQNQLANNVHDNKDASVIPLINLIPATKNLGRNLQTGNTAGTSFSWVPTALNPVQDQSYCGSCWSFASTSNIESMYYLKYKKLLKFSEQQLIDCSTANSGCNGGSAGNAFSYVKANGISLSSTYGVYQIAQKTCHYSTSNAAAYVTGFWYFSPSLYTEADLATYLQNYGPLAIAINANVLQYYTGGIWKADSTSCDPSTLNHAVNLVGFGTSAYGTPYWIIRNSWGPSWGENGYVRFYRGINMCGMANYVTQAVIA